MHRILAAAFALLALPAAAGEIASVYTDLNPEKDCAVLSVSQESDGASMLCPGFRGYPVLLFSGDARESVFYGLPPAEGEIAWESFAPFNSVGPKIEWRVDADGERLVPFAAIHRWFVSDAEDAEKKTEVLVVEKVGQLGSREGCAVGLVLATGNPNANEMARKVADEQARDFACGADERVIIGDPMPEFSRAEN